ncbi:MAG: sigma-54-dependent Fis family transcriptional regulator [Nitrospirae bacterium]|nr:sigma-54-dependent Fis family transcriptional regulator [Nitrospirota bacterium]
MSSILLVDDDDSLRRVLGFQLEEAGYDVTAVSSAEAAVEKIGKEGRPFDLVLTDLAMAGMDGIELLRRVKGESPGTEVIVITAFGTVESAVSAMKAGAFDYVTKPVSRDELLLTVDKALRMRRLASENVNLRAELASREGFGSLVGRSSGVREAVTTAVKVAATDATVLLLGESGTGKDLMARGIHAGSPRAGGPFVAINCAAIPEGLVESEMFGHVRGAFTGAVRDRAGKFEEAHGGTLFLDEIGDLKPDLQAKLLRVIETRVVERVGGGKPVAVDVRLIAATHRDLAEMIRKGTFREDLYYRLSVVSIPIPPLREREEDLPRLVDHFVRKFNREERVSVNADVLALLKRHAWPGNVRELENVIERASILRAGPSITRAELPPGFGEAVAVEILYPGGLPEGSLSLERLERELIERALRRFGGNQSRAARYLGISRPTLIYRMKKYGLREEGGEV